MAKKSVARGRSVAVREDWSARGGQETVSWKVDVRGANGGVHYTLLATPRLARSHRLQVALRRAAEAAARAIEPFVEELPT